MPSILYLTDLYYAAQGRTYYEEDLYLTARLQDHFEILIGHPQQALAFLDKADVLVFRNTGPVLAYQAYFERFLEAIRSQKITTFNSFDGQADIRGKQYLLELYQKGYPVIPSIESLDQVDRLGPAEQYVLKLKHGADSLGMEFLSPEALSSCDAQGKIIQPFVEFAYEISFYYINEQFQYALYAPDKAKRWELEEITPSEADRDFADSFIRWNAMQHGISRVDACRLPDGSLLLVELEDLNPFLSVMALGEDVREKFLKNWIHTLLEL